MATLTSDFLPYLLSLRQYAKKNNCRFGVVLIGSSHWNRKLCQGYLASLSDTSVFQLGGDSFEVTKYVSFNKGQQLLGQECGMLLCDLGDGWDANSFSAALGTLTGGGIAVIDGMSEVTDSPAEIWLKNVLGELIVLSEDHIPPLPILNLTNTSIDFSQQQLAINNIIKVVEGHRKRPVVLTADRGRGKSSALGMAASELMKSRNIEIIVTAPSLASVSPVFQFATKDMKNASQQRGLVDNGQSVLRFMSPDEILRSRPKCDLLLVDEAAALPLPILQSFVNHYHRAVFSSTIHGYEGSGRGFTLKFLDWLKSVRPEMRAQHIDQPIRWVAGDPLEAWHRKSFLLDFDFQPITQAITLQNIQFQQASKSKLLEQPELLHQIFSLLVNAHYQTSPNDLFHLLGDENMGVYYALHDNSVVACILYVCEGELEPDLIRDIQLGRRRPRGHLAPVTLANQLGITLAAQQSSTRIMRIAVHPDLQGQHIGSELVHRFIEQTQSEYVSTSFGATAPLVHFWNKCGFHSIKVGSQRDQASGCYSLLMVHGNNLTWLENVIEQFCQHFVFELADSLQEMEPELIRVLLELGEEGSVFEPHQLLEQYSLGGSNYESVAIWLYKLLLSLPAQLVHQISDLMIAKVLQRMSWQKCVEKFELAGRKQAETKLREELIVLLSNLQCKE